MAVGYARGSEGARAVADQIAARGPRAMTVAGDLSDPATPGRIFGAVEEQLGPVEILIANAGIGSAPAGILEIALPDWERTLAVNLTAPFLLAQRAFPAMLERGFGRIVFLSSVAAYTGGLIGAHYAASKAGLHGLAHSLARQGGSRGVTVNVIAPGLVDTDMIPAEPGRPRPARRHPRRRAPGHRRGGRRPRRRRGCQRLPEQPVDRDRRRHAPHLGSPWPASTRSLWAAG